MSKAFREAFPTLKLEEELEGLLDTTLCQLECKDSSLVQE